MVRGRKKKGTNRRCSSPTRACIGAHQVISPSIVTQSRHEPKIVTHGSDQQMLQHLLSIEQLPCVAGFRKGNGDVENTGGDSSNKGCFGRKTNLFRESGDFAGNRETWEIFREI